jgi:DNA-binding LacI/PurR family transcriptional regulator
MNSFEPAITLRTLSRLSGFSISTVSNALNNNFEISQDTRKIIKEIATEHNYVPNKYAVALRKKRTKAIAIIIPQINTEFYSCFLHKIEKVASTLGYRIVLFQSFEETKHEKECLRNINDGSVDAAIILSKNKLNSLLREQYHKFPIEYIQLSEELQEKQLKRKCINSFSNLLTLLDY